MMYKRIFFEISGLCNAKCPWCSTGNGSVKCKQEFIDPALFERAVRKMLESEMIGPKTVILLYDWGEPLLHPKFNSIIQVLHENKIRFGISTNCSKVVSIEKGLLEYLHYFNFAMPGFSQQSYDRIHGFDFNTIIANIHTMQKNLKRAGWHGFAHLMYLIYQFNIEEIMPAIQFCKKNRLRFFPLLAFFNDWNLAMGYLDNKLPPETMRKVSQDLLLYYVDKTISESPKKDHYCPQHNWLVLNEFCDVVTCCGVPRDHHDYSIGSLFDLTPGDIQRKKTSQSICKACFSSGLAYWHSDGFLPPAFVEQISKYSKKKPFTIESFIRKNTASPAKLYKKLVDPV